MAHFKGTFVSVFVCVCVRERKKERDVMGKIRQSVIKITRAGLNCLLEEG